MGRINDLAQITIQFGPHAGHTGFIAIRPTHFPFDRLPVELRQSVYRLFFTPTVHIREYTMEWAEERYRKRRQPFNS
jgi:hypothetical protein